MQFLSLTTLLSILLSVSSLCGAHWGPWDNTEEKRPHTPYFIPTLPQKDGFLLFCIKNTLKFHETVISPVDGPRSHFRPTSSKYMGNAMLRYGVLKGYIMGCDRLLRENNSPWVYETIEIGGTRFKWDPTWKQSGPQRD